MDWLLSSIKSSTRSTYGGQTMLVRSTVHDQRIEEFAVTKGGRVEFDRAGQEILYIRQLIFIN